MDEWNKPPYVSIHVPNNIIFKLLEYITPEYNSVRKATQLNNIYLTRLKVTALTNNKRVLLTKSIVIIGNRTAKKLVSSVPY